MIRQSSNDNTNNLNHLIRQRDNIRQLLIHKTIKFEHFVADITTITNRQLPARNNDDDDDAVVAHAAPSQSLVNR